MNIEHLKGNFDKRRLKNNLDYYLGNSTDTRQIDIVEKKLDVIFPKQIIMFYLHHNGLKVMDPKLEVYPIELLTKKNNLIYFFNI